MQRKIFFEEAPDRLTALPGHALPAWRRLDAWGHHGGTTCSLLPPHALLDPLLWPGIARNSEYHSAREF